MRAASLRRGWYYEMKKDSFISNFMSSDGNNVLYENKELMGSQGSNVTFGGFGLIDGDVVDETQDLEGKELDTNEYSYNVEIKEHTFGVIDGGPIHRQRPAYNIGELQMRQMQDRNARHFDEFWFEKMYTSPTFSVAPTTTGTSLTKANCTTSDKLTTTFLRKLKAGAKTGFSDAGVRAQFPIKPLRIGGEEMWVAVVSPEAMYDLKNSANYDEARRDAMSRSDTHDIFKGGGTTYWDGICVKESEFVTQFTDGGGASVRGCLGLFLGAGASGICWAQTPEHHKYTRDAGRKLGTRLTSLYGVGKAVYNSNDAGMVQLVLNTSDATFA